MAREHGLSRALRKLDRIPAGPALAVGLGAGAGLGFVCLRELSEAGVAGFVAFVAAAAPLAISARPVAVPAGEPRAEGARPTLGGRLKAALTGRAMLPARVVAVLLGVPFMLIGALVVVRGEVQKLALEDIPFMPAPLEKAEVLAPAPPIASSAGGQAATPARPPPPVAFSAGMALPPCTKFVKINCRATPAQPPPPVASSAGMALPVCGKFIKTNCRQASVTVTGEPLNVEKKDPKGKKSDSPQGSASAEAPPTPSGSASADPESAPPARSAAPTEDSPRKKESAPPARSAAPTEDSERKKE